MDLRQLRYFVSIVEEGSISEAARRLRVAQPALSHHVRELEATLGTALLIRGARGIQPTEAGRRLHEHALGILRGVDEALDQVRGLDGEIRGAVAVGLPSSVALMLAVPLIEATRERLPQVRLRLSEGMSGTILDWLHGNRLDLAILFDPPRERTLRVTALLAEDLHAVCPPGATTGDIAFAEAARLPLILPGRPHGLRERVERTARETGASLRVTVEIDGLPQIKTLIERGVGCSILSLSAVREEVLSGRLQTRRIVDPALERTVSLCSLRSRQPAAAVAAVREIVQGTIRDLVGRGIWPCRPCQPADTVCGSDPTISA